MEFIVFAEMVLVWIETFFSLFVPLSLAELLLLLVTRVSMQMPIKPQFIMFNELFCVCGHRMAVYRWKIRRKF